MIRRYCVLVHQWAGLAMAMFLIVVGLTGSVLAFRVELDSWLNLKLLTVAPRNALLAPFVLRQKAMRFIRISQSMMFNCISSQGGPLSSTQSATRCCGGLHATFAGCLNVMGCGKSPTPVQAKHKPKDTGEVEG